MAIDALSEETARNPDFMSKVDVIAGQARTLLSTPLRRGADYVDLFYEQTARSVVSAEATHNHSTAPRFKGHQEVVEGLGIRGFNKQHQALAAEAGWTPAAWPGLARQVGNAFDQVETAGPKVPDCDVVYAASLPDAPNTTSSKEKEEVLRAIIDAAYSYAPALSECKVAYTDTTRQTLVVNTMPAAIAQAQGYLGVRLEVALQGMPMAYATRGYRDAFGLLAFDTLDRFVRETIDRARLHAAAKPVPAGPMPVVFGPGWGGLWLHEALGHALEADVVHRETERLIGCRIGNETVTVVDDPTLPLGQGSFSYDDEGMPAQRTPLVEAGRLENLLYDRFHAHQSNQPSSSNGRRQHYRDAPQVRMTNLCLAAGETAPEDIIASVRDGIFVAAVSAGKHMRAAGSFEVHVLSGYRIEKGQLTHPIKDVAVTGEILTVLDRVRGVGNDQCLDRGLGTCEKAGQQVPVSVSSPTVLIDSLAVRQC